MRHITIPCLDYDLAADWYQGTTDEILLVFVGYSSNKKNYIDLVSYLTEATDASALVLDYSGHGESPFKLRDVTPAQNFLECITVFDWLRDRYPDKGITVVGTSYGGFMATQLTKYREFRKMVLRVPAIYEPQAFYDPWSKRIDNQAEHRKQSLKFRKNKPALTAHPLLARASKYKGKTFVVVHEHDELVPKETTDAYIKAFNADSYEAKGFAHSFNTDNPQADKNKYKHVVAEWIMNSDS